MKIKKYLAKTLQEGKIQILNELGDDAIILSHRTTINPENNESIVEIVAALDEKKEDSHSRTVREKISDVSQNKENRDSAKSGNTLLSSLLSGELKNISDLRESPKSNSSADSGSNTNSGTQKSIKHRTSERALTANYSIEDIGEIKNVLYELSDRIKYKLASESNNDLTLLHRRLMDAELSDNFALKIINKINSLDANYSTMVDVARNYIAEEIPITEPLEPSGSSHRVIFLGTSGSGKTSALVKIAVVNKLLHKSNILIISADTNKVGGAEQLETFAAIATIPFFKAYSPKELAKIIENSKDYDLILIDTAGKSHKDNKHMKELYDYTKQARANKIFLVQSANISLSTFKGVMDRFNYFKPDSIVLTKLDESDNIGAVLSHLIEKKLPISYLSTGQQIPEDIEPADKVKLSRLILPDA
jgi:flagellar biosynthesis protein FlhF